MRWIGNCGKCRLNVQLGRKFKSAFDWCSQSNFRVNGNPPLDYSLNSKIQDSEILTGTEAVFSPYARLRCAYRLSCQKGKI